MKAILLLLIVIPFYSLAHFIELKEEYYIKNYNHDSSPFSTTQIKFIINEFKTQLEQKDVLQRLEIDTNARATVTNEENTFIIAISDSNNNGPSIVFYPFYNAKFNFDIDKDNRKEIVFTVEESGGGNASWNTIYCLKEKNNGELNLVKLNYSCPFKKPYSCGDNPRPDLIDTDNNNLIINLGCFKSGDAACCPSLSYDVTFKYDKGKLVPINKKRIYDN